jgi:photosystem II stability/assembly factor-like uncharacterized protein
MKHDFFGFFGMGPRTMYTNGLILLTRPWFAVLFALICVARIQPGLATQITAAQSVWEAQTSGVTASFRGLSVVSEQVAWASGTDGTVIRTVDGGRTWTAHVIAGAEKLDFRDLHAFDEQTCVAVNAGSPGLVFRTVDGGKTWRETYRNDAKTIFFDAISFWDKQRGIAFSDPQNGKLFLIETGDGGQTWSEFSAERRPEMHPGEAAFAASGTSLAVMADANLWIATGGEHGPENESSARVFASQDAGKTWSVATTPIASNESSGIFSIAFANADHGVAVGGDYKQPKDASSNVAITDDSGAHWRTIGGPPPRGYRSAVAVLNLDHAAYFIAVGPTGSDFSSDWGNTWQPLDDSSFNSVAFDPSGATGWAVGPEGRVAKWSGNEFIRARTKE